MSEITVEIWSDLVCPWCYIGKRRLTAALDGLGEAASGVQVVWRSYQLDPDAPTAGDLTLPEYISRRQGVAPERVAEMLASVSETAAGEGLEYQLARARPVNTFDAHRLVHHAAEEGLAAEVTERLMAAYTAEGVSLADHDALAGLAAEAGLDGDRARETLAGDDHAAAVRSDAGTARRLRLTGVPSFVLGRRYAVVGAQPAAVLRDALTRARQEALAES
ncbi:DsbA family oxidoreductase [Streptomyces litchfieldiae]|uniref:DsbA family oxidoreductase n=1 Tax=Streptomyces litchfieldiae TaxID=3075543 RepID=A0ABU2MWE6_9ACTN|nr:DsbA family oxidoreductase [Streptomyces sp. DSM 44938]MDT0345967.1 DsbA family oxidoreductase [Streptomyces sp. DSM 44938]